MSNRSNQQVESIVKRCGHYLRVMVGDPHSLRGQQLRGGGPVGDFERKLAERCGFPYCLATSNATTALFVAVIAANLKDKAIYIEEGAWEGSIGALCAGGATLFPRRLDSLLSHDHKIEPAPAAIVATDRPSQRHDSVQFRTACDHLRCLYIEDTNRLPGISCSPAEKSLADIQVISFGPGKPLCLGEGGALLIRDSKIYEAAVQVSQHPERVVHELIDGNLNLLLNARIHPIAALLGGQLLGATGEISGNSNELVERPTVDMSCFDCGLPYPFEGLISMLSDDQRLKLFSEQGGEGVI